MKSELKKIADNYNKNNEEVHVISADRMKNVKKIIIPDFRVLFPSNHSETMTVYKDSSYQMQCFLGNDELGVILAEHFEESLLKTGKVEVLERNQLKRILNEQNLQMSGFVDAPTIEMGQFVGADTVLLGSVSQAKYCMPNDPVLVSMHVAEIRIRLVDLRDGSIFMLYSNRFMEVNEFIDEGAIYQKFSEEFTGTLIKTLGLAK